VLCLVNSLNLADGINGLAVGIIFFWLFYINQIYYHNNLNFLINIIFINLILIFIHNYMGRHFLGDSGSLMLSSFIAFLIIYLHNKNIDMPNSENSSETILIILIVPVLDMIRLLFERLSKKKNPGIGDNNHLHHYLIKKHSMLKALFAYFLLINIPILISFYSPINKLIIIIFIILIYFFLIFYYKTILKVK
jgi:UDP-GlcNAc:undecaprenyl-phosphate GlcNAc-1-phosphate transferase